MNITTKDQLIKWLLYKSRDGIIFTGVNGDEEVSEELEPKFRKKIEKLLEIGQNK